MTQPRFWNHPSTFTEHTQAAEGALTHAQHRMEELEKYVEANSCENALHAYVNFYRNLDRATFHIQGAENLIARDEDDLRAQRDELETRMMRKGRVFESRCLVRR